MCLIKRTTRFFCYSFTFYRQLGNKIDSESKELIYDLCHHRLVIIRKWFSSLSANTTLL